MLPRFALVLVMTAVSALAAESALRLVDGYGVVPLRLERRRPASSPSDRERVEEHVRTLPTANGVDRAWFRATPEPVARITDDLVDAQAAKYPAQSLLSVYEWNLQSLKKQACENPELFAQRLGAFEYMFAFEPSGGETLPAFRFLRHASYPSGMITNNFGWRGPDLALNKPPRTIRLAFVGASTTVGAHGTPGSYPEFLGVWLNLWAKARGLDVRFEVINAGREGISSDSIAAIVEQEVMPLEPDMVFYYEGANQFWPGDFIEWPDRQTLGRPEVDPRIASAWAIERYSAAAVRVHSLFERIFGTALEPKKPLLSVVWPPDLDEWSPRLDHPKLPVGLPLILSNLESMRRATASAGSELVVETFFWLVWDGLRLDPVSDAGPRAYLNKTFWPFTYAHMRRYADFQNRVFTQFARQHELPLIDFASRFPKDPSVMADAIHFTTEGTRLQAWVVLQDLIPLLEQRIQSGRLPRPDQVPQTQHPGLSQDPRRMVSTASIVASCRDASIVSAPARP